MPNNNNKRNDARNIALDKLDFSSAPKAKSAKGGKSDAEARLEELQTLYDRRLITEEEYQEKRRDILDRL